MPSFSAPRISGHMSGTERERVCVIAGFGDLTAPEPAYLFSVKPPARFDLNYRIRRGGCEKQKFFANVLSAASRILTTALTRDLRFLEISR